MPLLFTMEMWWLGPLVPPWKLLALLGVALLANLGLAYFAGFKQERGFLSHLEQAVDALPVESANGGDKIVEDLRVRLVLGSSQDQQEVTEVEVRFLAGGETNRAVAVFRSDPAAAPLTANAASYLEP